jgi:hypothetical protein
MMELNSSVVHRNLDAKLKIFGFELYDLLAILLIAAIMNLVFGRTSLSFLMVFLVPGFLAVILYFGKRNKPDQFLVHLVRYYLAPGVYSPGVLPKDEVKRKGKINE